nr:uncharacterized protein CI109_006973 [Kwoniella shandongensis]KAA5524715.1 hypothetical protein CI109_006973 [Kwoniella shandongensis]
MTQTQNETQTSTSTSGAERTTKLSTEVEVEVDIVRPFDLSKDVKILKMLVGQGVMEGLARANGRFLRHPLVIALILALGLIINHSLSFNPSRDNYLSYITPLIGPCMVLLPTIGIVEYIHRPVFTSRLRKTIGSIDLVSPSTFYTSSRSGIWVFEHKEEVVGVICLDTQSGRVGQTLESVLGDEEGQLAQQGILDKFLPKHGEGVNQTSTLSKSTSILNGNADLRRRKNSKSRSTEGHVAQIRHLDVDTPYRGVGVGTELLLIALDSAFSLDASHTKPSSVSTSTSTSSVEKVIVQTNPLSPDGGKLFVKAGFEPIPSLEVERMGLSLVEKVGVLGWKGRWMSVDKHTWIERRELILAKVSK